MAEKKSLVEEALIQMKSLENVVAENAKGILASTMKEEIGELVKESLKEQTMEEDSDLTLDTSYGQDLEEAEEDDAETDLEDMDMEDEEEDDNFSMDDEDEEEFDMNSMNSDDEQPIDLRNFSDEEILKVFKEMGDEDGIIVTKDGDTVDLEDSNADVHYKISMGESATPNPEDLGPAQEMEEEDNDLMYEISLDGDDDDSEFDWSEIEFNPEDEEEDEFSFDDEDEDDEEEFSFDDEDEDEDNEELVFEIEMEEDDSPAEIEVKGMDEDADFEKMETKEGFKAKGVGMGKPKFGYKKTTGGFKEDMKHGNPTKGTGKPKFEFKEGDDMIGSKKPMMKKPMMVKGGETTEASRTLGNGKRWGRNGLDKPKAAPQHLKVENVEKEMTLLRQRNEEYRKALNVFRSKLNEVAVFNSNLAYATRLFTEQSTTKQEKINILRRFDSVESLKESKTLYKTIKDELTSQNNTKVVKESLQEKMERTPSSGSAINLIESKTYENPQFMRMKDLMTKMNVTK